MRKYKPSAAQLQERAEKKERLAAIVRRLAAMPDEEREALAARLPVVTTCEGHPLTPRNTALLYFQNETGISLTLVGGFRQWIKAGRCVRKGQKGLTIFVPCGGRKPDAQSEPNESGEGGRTYFIGATVFDISQTEELTHENKPAPPDRRATARPLFVPPPPALADVSSYEERQQVIEEMTQGRTIWNSDGSDGPALICAPPPAPEPTPPARVIVFDRPPPGGWKESDKVKPRNITPQVPALAGMSPLGAKPNKPEPEPIEILAHVCVTDEEMAEENQLFKLEARQ